MTLKRLAALREQLPTAYNVNSIVATINDLQAELTQLIAYPVRATDQYEQWLTDQIQLYNNLKYQIETECKSTDAIIEQIDRDIEVKRQELFSGTYDSELITLMNDYDGRITRTRPVDSATKENVLERIRFYTDFHYPAIELGCGTGAWTNHLVAADPLYLVDIDQRFLDKTMEQFNDVYRNRVRPYLIDLFPTGERNLAQAHRLYSLPQEQHGFIFSWGFFNYLPLSVLKYYLPQMYDLLRPGGVALLHFNNGDTAIGAAYAEGRWHSYMSGREVVNLCKQSGFELLQLQDFNQGETSWLEIKKPGDLKTAKASQAMGAIRS